jgi:hypothetical protein
MATLAAMTTVRLLTGVFQILRIAKRANHSSDMTSELILAFHIRSGDDRIPIEFRAHSASNSRHSPPIPNSDQRPQPEKTAFGANW